MARRATTPVRRRREEISTLLAYIRLLYDEPINCLGRRQRFELADDDREPVLSDGVCDSVGPDIDKNLVNLHSVYPRGLGADDSGLFAIVSRGESAER